MVSVVMVGALPPPYTGQSVSFKQLVQSFEEVDDVNVRVINTAPKNLGHRTGAVTAYRVIEMLKVLVAFFIAMRCQPDTVYLTKGSTVGGFIRDLSLFLIVKCVGRRCKFIVHLKGGNYDTFYGSLGCVMKCLVRFFLKGVDHIIVLGDSLLPMYRFLPSLQDKLVVIENALPASRLSYPTKGVKNVDGSVNVLFLSNLIYSKGYGVLLDAVDILLKRGVSRFKVTYAGQFMSSPDDPMSLNMGLYQKRFIKRLNEQAYAGVVEYVGAVSGKAKTQVLYDADVFVLPTNYYVEGQPVSIIEAMAYKCAIVTTNYRSIPDLVEEGRNATFVPYDDPGALADAIQNLVENKALLSEFKSCSYGIFNRRFLWAVHFDKMRKLVVEK